MGECLGGYGVMGVYGGPNVVEDGLVLALDARNAKTYDDIPDTTDHGISDWYCFISGTATYSAIYPNTEIIEIDANSNETVMVSTGSDPQRGTFTTTAGRRYYGTKAIYLLQTTAADNQHELAPVSFAGTYFAHRWIRNSPTTYYAYAPQDDTTLEFFDNNTVGGVTGTVTATYSIPKGSTTSFTSTAVNTWQFFKADKPIIMTAGGSGWDKTILAPATQYNYKRRNANNITINNTAPSTSGTYVTYDTSLPVATVEIADGAGGDCTQGIGYEYLSNTYSWGNSLSDYQLVAPYADTTVTVSYWASNQWNVGEVHSLNGTQINPDAAFRDGTNGFGIGGSNISGSAAFLASGANLWKFEGTQPFALIINDTADDEERLLGWMFDKHLRTSSNVTQSFVNLIDKDDRSRMKIYGTPFVPLSASDYFEFDGVDDYIDLTESFISSNEIQTTTSSYTLEAWINVRSSSGTDSNAASIVGNAGNYGVGMQVGVSNGNPRMNYGFRLTNNFYGSEFSYNTWTHICLSRINGQSVKAYLNGNVDVSFSSTELSVPSGQTYENMRIGNGAARITGFYDGYIGIVRIYNRGLTDNEIQQNFIATRSRFGI
jgi:hypothetical protein